MPYQKLQTSNAAIAYTSDTENTINTRAVIEDGSLNAGTTGTTIVDSTGLFVTKGVSIGDLVVNTTDGVASRVVKVIDEATLVVITTGLFASGDSYEIWQANAEAAVLYVGVGGDLKVRTAGGDDVTFTDVPSGSFMPVQVIRVFTTGTTASAILALW